MPINTSKRARGGVLTSLPLVSTPFKRIGIGIVGSSLPRASGGHTHILVVVDYATCYHEYISLCSTIAPFLAKQLTTMQILTEQGTNFMGQVMQQFGKQ